MAGLAEVMGGPLSPELVTSIWSSVGVTIAPHIENKFSYKEFSGIAAFSERIFWDKFCAGDQAGPSTAKVIKPYLLTILTSADSLRSRQLILTNYFQSWRESKYLKY